MSLPEDFTARIEAMIASGQVDPVSRLLFNCIYRFYFTVWVILAIYVKGQGLTNV